MEGVLEINNPLYPALLKSINDPPKKLYWRGSLNEKTFDKCLSVVGSRKMSPYGQRVIEYFFSQFSKSIKIVSGFMYGVDTKAHEEALKASFTTIAVLPCGLDFIYPSQNVLLYRKIIECGGLLLSEYEGSMGPRTWTYLRRNRIVAGISEATLVVEASEKSGSLNTAELAGTYNRKVLSVPGNIFSEVSKGCLKLVKNGAFMVVSGLDVNEMIGFGSGKLFYDEGQLPDKDRDCRRILDVLKAYPLDLDDLSSYLTIPINILSSKVTQLCLSGKISEKNGRFYAG